MSRSKKRRGAPRVRIAYRLAPGDGARWPFSPLTWNSRPRAITVARAMKPILVEKAKAVLRARVVSDRLYVYDIFNARLGFFCRHYGIPRPRLPKKLQAELTLLRRGTAVLARLKGERL